LKNWPGIFAPFTPEKPILFQKILEINLLFQLAESSVNIFSKDIE